MQPLEVHQDPTFDTDLEVADLRQTRCGRCLRSVAEVHCRQCKLDFCGECESQVHRKLESLALKDEESKGDGRPHQEYLQSINVCQVCTSSRAEFLCVDCKALQCENCCANQHLRQEPNSGHYFFCVEGSPARKLCYASWSPAFLQLIKTKKRQLQDRALSATAPRPRPRPEAAAHAAPAPSGTRTAAASTGQAARPAVQVKSEPDAQAPQTADSALGEMRDLSIAEAPPALAPASRAARLHETNAVVDLTLDEDDSSSEASQEETSSTRVKQEPRVKAEGAWLQSATGETSAMELSIDEMLSMEEDPVVRSMVAKYNELSRRMFAMEQRISQSYDKMKRLSMVEPLDLAEVGRARKALTSQRTELSQETQKRNAVVANVVLCLKPEQQDLAEFLEKECMADVPHAQTASHKKCAMLEAAIRTKLAAVQRLKLAMEDAISMKKGGSLAEVTRLGTEIAAAEAEAKALDKERLGEFLVLCQFSQQIQTTVREIAL